MKSGKSDHHGQLIYFSHGGGPLPILADPSHEKMIRFMHHIPTMIHRPEAIIVFSAHWEENVLSIQNSQQPSILYDYYGFPAAAYKIEYPCRGSRELAAKADDAIQRFDINCRLDDDRPYDHGSYIPLKMMYPEADIPVIQISLDHSLDPLAHLNIGKALMPLLAENVLIIGSGFSFHNLNAFDFAGREIPDLHNDAFQDSLVKICCNEEDEAEKWQQLAQWVNLPWARYCHPREEHLLPLHVCVGAAAGKAQLIFDDYILGKRAVAFLWRQSDLSQPE
ncbi:MAG: class III extradiol ring-cleavage dioxygenase [Bacillota bacterium]|nr:class III extradiol ring-cleavage dioxygenase [Bacillota bacterium]